MNQNTHTPPFIKLDGSSFEAGTCTRLLRCHSVKETQQ